MITLPNFDELSEGRRQGGLESGVQGGERTLIDLFSHRSRHNDIVVRVDKIVRYKIQRLMQDSWEMI